MQERKLVVTAKTTFDEFQGWMLTDERTRALDRSNLLMVYESLREKAVEEERERQRAEEQKVHLQCADEFSIVTFRKSV